MIRPVLSILATFLSFLSFSQDWTPMGNPLVGVNHSTEFGYAAGMTSAGDFCIVGAHASDVNGYNTGQAIVYHWNPNTSQWETQASTFNGFTGGIRLGESVCFSGDGSMLAYGIPGSDSLGVDKGMVEIRQNLNPQWPVVYRILGTMLYEQSGYRISMDETGDNIAIAAQFGRIDPNPFIINFQGAVRVYHRVGNGYTLRGSTLNGPTHLCDFGETVKLSSDGNTLLVSAPHYKIGNSTVGRVSVYRFVNGDWQLKGLPFDGAQLISSYGLHADIDATGDILAITSQERLSTGQSVQNRVRIYEWGGTSWTLQATLAPPQGYHEFAKQVSLSRDGNRIAIAAPEETRYGSTGVIYIYEKDANGNWNQVNSVVKGHSNRYSTGTRLALDSTGQKLLVTAMKSMQKGPLTGEARLYCGDGKLGIDTIVACDQVTLLGTTYTESTDSAYFAYPLSSGCDSVVYYRLEITNIDEGISLINSTFHVSQSNANYQWFDCDTKQPIPGATNQSFTATADGNYAVALELDGCVDTSDCLTVQNVDLAERGIRHLKIYPNPGNGDYYIDLPESAQTATLEVVSSNGQLIDRRIFNAESTIHFHVNWPSGLYLIRLSTDTGQLYTNRIIHNAE